jgi:phage terminase large subunit GpA-like protein
MSVFAAFRPPLRLSAVEFAEEHLHLPEAGASRGAKWRAETCPYVPGILRAATEEKGVRRISIKKGAQEGLTTAMLALVAHLLANRPTPVLWVTPTTRQAMDFAKGPLADVLRRTPALSGIVDAPRKRGEPGSSLLVKLAPGGGSLILAGGNSPNSFAAISTRVTVMDDADRVPAAVSEEGDPVHLITARTTAWPDALCIFLSTPVLANGRIETLYRDSDRRKWFVTCPRCGAADYTTFSDEAHWFVKFDNHDPRTARLRCPRCSYDVGERERMAVVRGGEWRPTATPAVPGHVGFEVWNSLSPFVSLEQMTEKFLTANAAGPRALREVLALHFACGWKEEADSAVSESDLIARAEDF